jgi:WD40 repeat protein
MLLRRENTQALVNLTESRLLGVGGEAHIYSLPQDPKLVAKIYHHVDEARAHKLAAMIANPPRDPMAAQGHTSLVWPVDLLRTLDARHQVAGFLMPRVSQMRCVIDFYHPGTRRKQTPLFNYAYLHRTARNLAAAVRALHASGYVIGDVNESNVLVAETALVTLVDTDSFQVRDPQSDAVYRSPVGKAEFTPPELQGKIFAETDRSPEHDLFGLGVLIFQLLMEGTHPYAGVYTGAGEPPPIEARILAGHFPYGAGKGASYRPMPAAPPLGLLTPQLRQFFVRCFIEGYRNPAARPSAQMWQEALKEAEDTLRTCAANPQHRYGHHLQACPWCKRAQQLGARDPFPSPEAIKRGRHLQPAPRKATKVIRPAYQAAHQVARPAWRQHSAPVLFRSAAPPPAPTFTVSFPSRWTQLRRSIGGYGRFLFSLILLATLTFRVCVPALTSTAPVVRTATLPPIPKLPLSEPPLKLTGHKEPLTGLAFSRDGGLIATGSKDKSIRLWDSDTGHLKQALPGHLNGISALAFSPDGRLLASGSTRYNNNQYVGLLDPLYLQMTSNRATANVALWDAQTGQLRLNLNASAAQVTALAFSPDNRTLAIADSAQTLTLADTGSGEIKQQRSWYANWVVSLSFSADGQVLMAGDDSGNVFAFNTQAESERGYTLIGGETASTRTIALSPDGKQAALVRVVESNRWFSNSTVITGCAIELWDLTTNRRAQTMGEQIGLTSVLAFSPDGRTLVSGGAGGILAFWDAQTGRQLRLWRGHDSEVMVLAFSPDGTKLVTSAYNAPYEAVVWRR